MTDLITLHADETDPDRTLAWPDPDGTGLWDLSGRTMAAQVIDRNTNEIVVEIAAVAGGTGGSALSNVAIGFAAAELAALDDGRIRWLKVTAADGADVAVFTVDAFGTLPLLRVLPAATEPAP